MENILYPPPGGLGFRILSREMCGGGGKSAGRGAGVGAAAAATDAAALAAEGGLFSSGASLSALEPASDSLEGLV